MSVFSKLGRKTNSKIKFIKEFLFKTKGVDLHSAREVYEYMKTEIPELKVLRNTPGGYVQVFDVYYHYLQGSPEEKKLCIANFVADREKKLARIRNRKEKQKSLEEGKPSDSFYSHENAKKLYASEEWRTLRYEILKRDKGICQLCGRSRKDGIKMHVDHIVPLSKDWSKRLDPNNLQVLCEDCNFGKSNRDCIDWR